MNWLAVFRFTDMSSPWLAPMHSLLLQMLHFGMARTLCTSRTLPLDMQLSWLAPVILFSLHLVRDFLAFFLGVPTTASTYFRSMYTPSMTLHSPFVRAMCTLHSPFARATVCLHIGEKPFTCSTCSLNAIPIDVQLFMIGCILDIRVVNSGRRWLGPVCLKCLWTIA